MKSFTYLLTIVPILFLSACGGTPQDNASEEDQATDATTPKMLTETENPPVDLVNTDFSIDCDGAQIMITSPKIKYPIPLAQEPSCEEVFYSELSNHGMPGEVAFALNTTDPSTRLGNYYYGVAEGNELKVYRVNIQNPKDIGGSLIKNVNYQLYRKYQVFKNNINIISAEGNTQGR